MSIIFVVSSPMRLRGLGSSLLNRSLDSCVLAASLKRSELAVLGIPIAGHSRNLLNGALTHFSCGRERADVLSSYYMLMHSSQWTQGGADPKSFCATILKQTLTDPDKYQIGLTKVFLRAGMLAYLESRRLDRLNSLATVIQKNFKRTMERNRYQRMRRAAIKIQAWWRGIMAKQLVLSLRKDVAARRLQAAARRFVQRRKFLEVHNSVVKLQSRKSEHLRLGA